MGETSAPPITAELWARLKRFDPHCFIGFERTTPFWRRQWKHVPRVWRVTVHAHDALAWEYLHAENPSLELALVEALEHAERMGWDRPDWAKDKDRSEPRVRPDAR